MNVFSDFHHSSLYNSLQLLIEKRLGWNLYRSIGMQWFENGYWRINNQLDTAKQYLEIRSGQGIAPKDGTPNLNKSFKEDDIYECEDEHHHTFQHAITFEKFMSMPIDIVIASIPAHIEPFKELARMKGAKFIFQMGNVFPDVDLTQIPNLMANTLPQNIPGSCHYIQYHQQFDITIFRPSITRPEKLITSFINVYHENAGYEDFLMLKSMMPDFEFLSYGGQCINGTITGIEKMAMMMQQSYFILHSKRMGDGYGHSLYNAFACGKPVITRISDYKGKLGEELLEDGVTCIDLDVHNYLEVSSIISNMSPDKYNYMSQQAYQRSTDRVDFDKEGKQLALFMEELQ